MANGWVIISGLIFIAGIGVDCGCKVDDKADPQKQEDRQKEGCRDNRKIAGDPEDARETVCLSRVSPSFSPRGTLMPLL